MEGHKYATQYLSISDPNVLQSVCFQFLFYYPIQAKRNIGVYIIMYNSHLHEFITLLNMLRYCYLSQETMKHYSIYPKIQQCNIDWILFWDGGVYIFDFSNSKKKKHTSLIIQFSFFIYLTSILYQYETMNEFFFLRGNYE